MKATKEKVINNNSLPDDDNIDKIRDILFGVQVKDFEKRFAKLEANLDKSIVKTQKDTQKRLDSLESVIKKEIGALLERIYVEQDSRNAAIKGVSEEIEVTTKTFEKELSKTKDKSESNNKKLRENFAEKTKTMTAEFREKQKELSASLKEKSTNLESAKVDREMLAKAFSMISESLSGKSSASKK